MYITKEWSSYIRKMFIIYCETIKINKMRGNLKTEEKLKSEKDKGIEAENPNQ